MGDAEMAPAPHPLEADPEEADSVEEKWEADEKAQETAQPSCEGRGKISPETKERLQVRKAEGARHPWPATQESTAQEEMASAVGIS